VEEGIARDGKRYTREEFVEHYGEALGKARWDEALALDPDHGIWIAIMGWKNLKTLRNGDYGMTEWPGPLSHHEAIFEVGAYARAQECEWPAVILETLNFHNPDSKHLWRHMGTHPDMMRDVVDHKDFVHWLSLAKCHLMHAIHLCGRRILIVSFCKGGKHRSVAVAEIIAHVLNAVEGYGRAGIRNLSFELKDRSCPCDECNFGKSKVVDRTRCAILNRAAQIWRNV